MNLMRNPDCVYKPVDEAIAEWHDLFKPMESIGFTVRAYDPGVSFSPQKGRESINMSISDLRIINDAILGKKIQYRNIIMP